MINSTEAVVCEAKRVLKPRRTPQMSPLPNGEHPLPLPTDRPHLGLWKGLPALLLPYQPSKPHGNPGS